MSGRGYRSIRLSCAFLKPILAGLSSIPFLLREEKIKGALVGKLRGCMQGWTKQSRGPSHPKDGRGEWACQRGCGLGEAALATPPVTTPFSPSAVPNIPGHSLSPLPFLLILTPLLDVPMIFTTHDLLLCVSTASQVWLKVGKLCFFSVSEEKRERMEDWTVELAEVATLLV